MPTGCPLSHGFCKQRTPLIWGFLCSRKRAHSQCSKFVCQMFVQGKTLSSKHTVIHRESKMDSGHKESMHKSTWLLDSLPRAHSREILLMEVSYCAFHQLETHDSFGCSTPPWMLPGTYSVSTRAKEAGKEWPPSVNTSIWEALANKRCLVSFGPWSLWAILGGHVLSASASWTEDTRIF